MTKQLTLALPDAVAKDAADAANAAGESLELFAARALEAQVERDRTHRFFQERRARANIPRALEFLRREGGEPPCPDDELPEEARPEH